MVALIGTILVALCTPAVASPDVRPQIRDATGDWVIASADIVSVQFSVVGLRSQRKARIHLSAAQAPSSGQPVTYSVSFATPTCEVAMLVVDWAGGVAGLSDDGYLDRSGCTDQAALVRESRLDDTSFMADTHGVTWFVDVDALGGAGAELTHLAASTRLGGRVSADGATSDARLPVGDEATGDSWTVPR
jgi:hypothetical protein